MHLPQKDQPSHQMKYWTQVGIPLITSQNKTMACTMLLNITIKYIYNNNMSVIILPSISWSVFDHGMSTYRARGRNPTYSTSPCTYRARGRNPTYSTSPVDILERGLMCSISIFSTSLLRKNNEIDSRIYTHALRFFSEGFP